MFNKSRNFWMKKK